jgi:hypothetical protein
MDQLPAGSLGSLKDFGFRHSGPDTGNTTELFQRTFSEMGEKPALAIRRVKQAVAKYLPE